MLSIPAYLNRTWAEVDLDAVRANIASVRQKIGQKKLCCIVKANAYGHGAVRMARLFEDEGADFLAVSNIEEAMQLRKSGVSIPVLILGLTDPRCAEKLASLSLSQCVFSAEYARRLSAEARKAGVSIKVHLKIDTGMGRIGFLYRDRTENEIDEAASSALLPGFEPEGVFTHFSTADLGEAGREYAFSQFGLFLEALERMKKKGVVFSVRHCANSAAILAYPETHLDMVRAGIVLYGMPPSPLLSREADLRPALALKTVVSRVKTLLPGESVSYGRLFTADRPMKVATVPVGYADGFWSSNSRNGLRVEIDGSIVPILGSVCMDQCVLDVSSLPSVSPGDVATLYGGKVPVSEVARINGTSPYEVLCAIGERVPRVYLSRGLTESIFDSILPVDPACESAAGVHDPY